jgi:hypothetical protein
VLAHGYVREDHVLDEELPLWVPIPPLAEVQLALEQAVADVTQLSGYELKRLMRTGTVASTDNRNWELLPSIGDARPSAASASPRRGARHGKRHHRRQRLPLPRALRHAAVRQRQAAARRDQAARHGQPFYRERVDQHLRIGMRAIELLRQDAAARHGDAAAQPQAAQLRRGGVPVAPMQHVPCRLRVGTARIELRGFPSPRAVDEQAVDGPEVERAAARHLARTQPGSTRPTSPRSTWARWATRSPRRRPAPVPMPACI